mmetsp:Transcript_9845/g.38403  ORF Transcript_9845/g.38403 Transcript_9845/m.38403 type:complete len:222 (-) Transcript_9845:2024-2689(-)
MSSLLLWLSGCTGRLERERGFHVFIRQLLLVRHQFRRGTRQDLSRVEERLGRVDSSPADASPLGGASLLGCRVQLLLELSLEQAHLHFGHGSGRIRTGRGLLRALQLLLRLFQVPLRVLQLLLPLFRKSLLRLVLKLERQPIRTLLLELRLDVDERRFGRLELVAGERELLLQGGDASSGGLQVGFGLRQILFGLLELPVGGGELRFDVAEFLLGLLQLLL